MTGTARLKPVVLPDYGVPRHIPKIAAATYQARFARFMDRITEKGLDAAVVYADREHCANMSWLTGFDPRFEEALLVAVRGQDPVIVTGPENAGPAAASLLGASSLVWPGFGLLGQDRTKALPLPDLLAKAGLQKGHKIGAVGWKYFLPVEVIDADGAVDLPAYVAALLAAIGPVSNATGIMMNPVDGLRAEIEIEELARFEFLATHGSESVKRVIFGLKPGMTEFEAASLMQPLGYPLCCHPMLSTGERARFGLGSPSDVEIERGAMFTTAFGYQGSLTARAGYVVESADELPADARDYADAFVARYWEAAAEWYETIGIDVTGGEIDARMRARLDNDFFKLALNPGHLLHIDEWMHSPIRPGSTESFRSGQAIQLDMIPAPGNAYFSTNIEDGIALLDERGRAEFAERFPDAWARIEARRAFMADGLGIRMKPEVLPFSNLAGWLPAYLLNPGLAISRA
ncbi:aminopeptidase P family N-terminal domain-containing protein [Mesorhizobium sp. KR9-304]|uniref:aminopeptidase P family N-terminal domain-containing protein n=1 Tax=Mesorhizobium sp. KR9-304 TaxID=3156614 RepID=UPI0032B57E77